MHHSNMWKLDEHPTWGLASRFDSEPGISASGVAITVATEATRIMSPSSIVSSFKQLEDEIR